MRIKLLILPFLLLSFVAILLTSCSKKPHALNDIEGTWDVSSFRLDDEEMIGVAFEEFVLDFGAYQNTNGKLIIHSTAMGSSPSSDTGTYTMSDEGGMLSVKTTEEEREYNYAISNSMLTLFGVDADGTSYSMVATR